MKIAIMMRAIDQPTGLRSYMEGVVSTLLRIDQEDEYLLLYRKPDFLGRFSGHKNVKEMLIGPSHVLLWDQVAVPLAARREGADIIWNPKFSVPLLSHCPVTMVLQELIEVEATEHIGAGRYERTETRTTDRNGSRPPAAGHPGR